MITAFSVEDLFLCVKKIKQKKQKIAFVSGNFNIIHPGHLRLLSFAAESAECLIVGVCPDGGQGIYIPEQIRLGSIQAIRIVDFAFILPVTVEVILETLKPDIVVKGKEHEYKFNSEKKIIQQYGGKLLFASGETWLSHLDQLEKNFHQSIKESPKRQSCHYFKRHGIHINHLSQIIDQFSNLRVAVIGDLIVDEYIHCDPLGMSREDPVLVVTPFKEDLFIGGSAIVAAHASALGAKVHYFSMGGDDQFIPFVEDQLEKTGVDHVVIKDHSRITTLKQRFRSQDKTLLKVSKLRQHDIDQDLQALLLTKLKPLLESLDLLIFSDFSYGCLPKELVHLIVEECKKNKIPMVADSQSSSQIGHLAKFQNMLLLTPTEHEARLTMNDHHSGLVALAEKLIQKTNAKHMFITLAAEGVLIFSPHSDSTDGMIDQLPAFNTRPKDTAGAGDSLFIVSAMALVSGGSIWESAYLGSVSAACQVNHLGNIPLNKSELQKGIFH